MPIKTIWIFFIFLVGVKDNFWERGSADPKAFVVFDRESFLMGTVGLGKRLILQILFYEGGIVYKIDWIFQDVRLTSQCISTLNSNSIGFNRDYTSNIYY